MPGHHQQGFQLAVVLRCPLPVDQGWQTIFKNGGESTSRLATNPGVTIGKVLLFPRRQFGVFFNPSRSVANRSASI